MNRRLPRLAALSIPILLAAACGPSDADDTAADAAPPEAATAPAPPPFDLESATFVVSASVDGDPELFLVEGRADTAWTRLTWSPGLDASPRWVPGRRSIVFHSARGGPGAPELDLFLLDVAAEFADDGTLRMRDADAVRLTDAPGPDYLAAPGPQGRTVAFVSRRPEAPETAATTGHVYELRVPERDGPAAPDGDLPSPTRRTARPIGASLPPAWMPDGEELLFVRRTDLGTEIVAMPAIGSGERRIHADTLFNYTPVPSPDGAWLAYTAEDDAAARVVVIRPDGRDRRVVTTEGRLYVRQWLPDGDRLIVSSWYRDTDEVDTMLLDLADGSMERLFTGTDRRASEAIARIR